MLTINNIYLKKGSPSKDILKGISATFSPGKISLLMGKSGAGKSSLLRCIAQLEPDYKGEVLFNGTVINKLSASMRARTLSYINQKYVLFPHLNALDNCIQPVQLVNKMPRSEAKEKALAILSSLGMLDYRFAFPSELSGGQQQRIAIARALCLDSQIIIFDEPSSALDPDNSTQLAHIFKQLALQGKTLVISTQDILFAEQLEGTCYYMENGFLK